MIEPSHAQHDNQLQDVSCENERQGSGEISGTKLSENKVGGNGTSARSSDSSNFIYCNSVAATVIA